MIVENWLYKRALTQPEQLALVYEGKEWTFCELFALSCEMSSALAEIFADALRRGAPKNTSKDTSPKDTSKDSSSVRKAGVVSSQSGEHEARPPMRVGLLCNNSDASYVLILALMNLGVQMVLLNTRLSVAELSYQIDDAQVTQLFFSADVSTQAQELAHSQPYSKPLHAIALEPLWEHVQANSSSGLSALKASAVSSSMANRSALPSPLTPPAVTAPVPSPLAQPAATVPLTTSPAVNAVTATNTSDAPPYHIRREFDLDEVMSILYTSGTTGQPKGVMQSYGNHLWSSIAGVLTSGIMPSDAWVCAVPLFHISGLSILVRGLAYGIPVYLFQKFDAQAINAVLLASKATIVSVVAYMLTKLIDDLEQHGYSYPPSFRYMLLGGGFFADSLLESCARLRVPVIRSFGMSETCSQVIATPLRPDYYKPGSSGLPLLPNQLRIAHLTSANASTTDASGGTAGIAEISENEPYKKITVSALIADADRASESHNAGRIGEIQIKSPALCVGYVNKPEAYAAAFTDDGWYKTGDIGLLDKDGFLYVKSRLADLIISGGENIYPAEVENVLMSHSAIREAAVVGHPDATWGYVPWAYLVAAWDSGSDMETADDTKIVTDADSADSTDSADETDRAVPTHNTVPTPDTVPAHNTAGLRAAGGAVTAHRPARIALPSDAELTAFMRAHLARYKVPRRFIWLDQLPKTSIGKIQKFKLLEQSERDAEP